jgi:hypothetical protein
MRVPAVAGTALDPGGGKVIMKSSRAPPQVTLWTCGLVGFSPSDLLGYWVVRMAQVRACDGHRPSGLLAYKDYRLLVCTVLGSLPEVSEDFLGVT